MVIKKINLVYFWRLHNFISSAGVIKYGENEMCGAFMSEGLKETNSTFELKTVWRRHRL